MSLRTVAIMDHLRGYGIKLHREEWKAIETFVTHTLREEREAALVYEMPAKDERCGHRPSKEEWTVCTCTLPKGHESRHEMWLAADDFVCWWPQEEAPKAKSSRNKHDSSRQRRRNNR